MLGIFDSGVGGLTVLKALIRINPDIDFIYLGDTARVPYGNKSKKTIFRYAHDDIDFLIRNGATQILSACNTVSSLPLENLKSSYKIPIYGVIEPAVTAAVRITKGKVAVIGTKSTIDSHIYKNKLNRHGIEVFEQATPLLVPFIEEGWVNKAITDDLVNIYMKPIVESNADTLILGCTHYPMLYENIKSATGGKLRIISSADATAEFLSKKIALNGSGNTKFFATDSVESFKKIGAAFLANRFNGVKEVSL